MSDAQSQDYSIVGRALEGLEALSEQDQAIQQLQEERKLRKAQLIEELSRMLEEVPLKQAFAAASDVYWADPNLADAVKRAYVAATRHGLIPRPTPTEVLCEQCGELVTATSWANYKSVVSHAERRHDEPRWGIPSLCSSCTERRQAEQLEHSRASSKAYREQWEAAQEEQRRKAQALHTMPLAKYLQTEHWQLLRQAALKAAAYRCQLCNVRGVLSVHLRTQESRGHESLADLVVLCQECHSSFQLIQDIRTA